MITALLTCAATYFGCNYRNATSEAPPAAEPSASTPAKVDETSPAADAPKPLPPEPDDGTRWLFAEAASDNSKGGWIEGSFDASKNKIEIRTKDTARFRIDTSRMGINWDKLVVMNIDGKGAELRRRENPIIQFEHDGAGHWKVVE